MKTLPYPLTFFFGLLFFTSGCDRSADPATAEKFTDSIPAFTVDPFWPKPLPNNWLMGQVGGVAVDSKDNIWIIQRPKSLGKEETDASDFPPAEFSIIPAPPIIQFDREGNMIQAWGGPSEHYDWPETMEHGIFIDHEDNVWINGGGPDGHQVLKFRPDGTFLLRIGQPRGLAETNGIQLLASPSQVSTPKREARSNDTLQLGTPTDFAVNPNTNEVFVSDGYLNHRVIVFDATTGKYKRHWGAYGKKPVDLRGSYDPGYPPSQRNPPDADVSPLQQLSTVHGIGISNDELVYVCDRSNNRIQVFEKNGEFVFENFIAKSTLGYGSVWDLAFSHDPQQTFVYVSDGTNNCVRILRRDKLEEVGRFGRLGRYAGQFIGLHNVATDSKGNIYTTEVFTGKRVQKFVLQ